MQEQFLPSLDTKLKMLQEKEIAFTADMRNSKETSASKQKLSHQILRGKKKIQKNCQKCSSLNKVIYLLF